MSVWIVNPFDNLPAEGSRPLRFWLLARAFVAAGHRVVYWTSSFSHTAKAPRPLPAQFEAEGIIVRLVPTPPYARNVGFARIRNHRQFARTWQRLAIAEGAAEAPAVIVASLPPLATGHVALALGQRYGAKVIADVMDDWPGTFYRLFPRGLRFLARLASATLERARNRFLRGADRVIAVSERYAELARAVGAQHVRRIYHGIECAPRVMRSTAQFDALHLVYLGSMGRTYDLMTLLEAMIELPTATLELIGSGEQEASLQAATERLGLGARVKFRGYLSGEAIRERLAQANCGIIPMRSESCVGIPYKLADYACAGLAIVSSLAGESADLLVSSGAGALYSPANVSSFVATLKAVAPRLSEMGTRARELAETTFDAASLYRDYVRGVLEERE